MIGLWKAVRAVTVETFGVLAVVTVLFGAAGWTAESAGVRTGNELRQAWEWLQRSSREVQASLTPEVDRQTREQYVEQRLEHYSRAYRQAAIDYLHDATQDLPRPAHDLAQPDPSRPVTSNQLLGAL